jgi:hypothetical protein
MPSVVEAVVLYPDNEAASHDSAQPQASTRPVGSLKLGCAFVRKQRKDRIFAGVAKRATAKVSRVFLDATPFTN